MKISIKIGIFLIVAATCSQILAEDNLLPDCKDPSVSYNPLDASAPCRPGKLPRCMEMQIYYHPVESSAPCGAGESLGWFGAHVCGVDSGQLVCDSVETAVQRAARSPRYKLCGKIRPEYMQRWPELLEFSGVVSGPYLTEESLESIKAGGNSTSPEDYHQLVFNISDGEATIQSLQACCTAEGKCLGQAIYGESCPPGGIPAGKGTRCFECKPRDPDTPPLAVGCCVDGSCSNKKLDECAEEGGFPLLGAGICKRSDDECCPPARIERWACCGSRRSCTTTTARECDEKRHRFLPGKHCIVGPCEREQPFGGCCDDTEACYVTTKEECGELPFFPGGCPVKCPLNGACYLPCLTGDAETCQQMSLEMCTQRGGRFDPGGVCQPMVCPEEICDLNGSWRNNTTGIVTTWVFTGDGDSYGAVEKGGCSATGQAVLSGRELTLQWSCPMGYAGSYTWELSADCSSASGYVIHSGSRKPAGGPRFSSTLTR